jgi:hypothetical protein
LSSGSTSAFGARLYAPTAEDSLGTGRWQIMPGAGVRYTFLELGEDTFFVPKLRYAISFAGDPSRRNISETQFAPTLNIQLPDRWFLRFYDLYDVRVNFVAPVAGQTGRLFLPFDAPVGKKLADGIVLMWEASVPMIKDYPVYTISKPISASERSFDERATLRRWPLLSGIWTWSASLERDGFRLNRHRALDF